MVAMVQERTGGIICRSTTRNILTAGHFFWAPEEISSFERPSDPGTPAVRAGLEWASLRRDPRQTLGIHG
jgi:hypothetical protein